jgi:hypothetical protein
MKKLISILNQHSVESVIMDSKLYAKSHCSQHSVPTVIFFTQYEEVNERNIYSFLGY